MEKGEATGRRIFDLDLQRSKYIIFFYFDFLAAAWWSSIADQTKATVGS